MSINIHADEILCLRKIQVENKAIGEVKSLLQLFQASCESQVQNACESLDPNIPIVHTYENGTVLFNPRYVLPENPPQPIAKMLDPNQINIANYEGSHNGNLLADSLTTPAGEGKITVLFHELKSILVKRIEKSLGANIGETSFSHLEYMGIEILDRERCRRPNRTPIVASIDPQNNRLVICPLMTHLNATSLVAILAHELGHAIDPCRYKLSESERVHHPYQNIHNCLAQNRSSANQCPRAIETEEEEIYADLTGAALADEFLRIGHPILEFSSDHNQRIIEFMNFRMVGCEEQINHEFYQGEQAQSLLNCSDETNDDSSLPPHRQCRINE